MDLKEITPLVIYDNECYLCVQFAKFVNFLTKGRLHFVGHYTDFGKKIRESVLDSNALEMFWFIDNILRMAVGLPLVHYFLQS